MKIECVGGEPIEIDGDLLLGIRFDGLNMHRALLDNQVMCGSSFIKTDLRGAFISDADMSCCNFERASLITTSLMRTTMRAAILTSCRAYHCQFDKSDLSEANLEGANIHGASFDGATLCGANLLCEQIELASFKGAVFDSRTIWPPGFDPIAAGAVANDEAPDTHF